MSFTLLLLVSKLAIAFPTKASTFILQLNLLKLSLGSIALITYSLSLFLIYPSSFISLDKFKGYKKESVLSPVDNSLSMQ